LEDTGRPEAGLARSERRFPLVSLLLSYPESNHRLQAC